jgi:hypothetical protein
MNLFEDEPVGLELVVNASREEKSSKLSSGDKRL